MGVQSHFGITTTTMGRPPRSHVESRRCAHMRTLDNGKTVRCGLYATWLIPEVTRCADHMPHEWLSVAQRRLVAWERKAAAAWDEVLAEVR